MTRHVNLCAGIIAALLGLSLMAMPGQSLAQTAVSMGTSSAGARFHILAVGMGDVISRHSKLNVTVEPIGGSDANVRALKAKRIDFALLNSLAATHGYRGIGSFEKEGKAPLRLILQGGLAARALVARADSGIRTPADLRGKKIQARRRALADLETLLKQILKVYGVPQDQVTIYAHSNTNEEVEALKLGTADAAMMPFGSPKTASPPIRRLAETVPLVVVGLDKDKIPAILENPELAGYAPATIYKGAIKGVKKDITSVALREYVVGRADLPDEVVYQFTKAFFSNLKDFYPVHASARQFDLEGSLTPPNIPYHPGAVRYYKEVGRWTPKLESLQSKLLK
ncbi:MAG TPA: TAXI family TRAP transporter solute-binding subunit [Terriglobales bacterium]|nr:TAXI family TRAP transporter solute-binding subunit [Terriglobales bacterium]